MPKKKPSKPAGKSKAYQVFVSHATADKWLATTLCEKIKAQGATTFLDDREIDGGDDIPETIRLQIQRSREMLVLLTPESVNRKWVMLEVGAAWGRGPSIRIVCIMCHVDVEPIPSMLKSKKAFPLNDFDLYLTKLKLRIEAEHGH